MLSRLTVLLIRLTHFMPKSAIWTMSRALILTVLHWFYHWLSVFMEECSANFFRWFRIRVWALKKIVNVLMLELFLINIKTIFRIKTKRHAGSKYPFEITLSNLECFIVFPPLMMQDPGSFNIVLIQPINSSPVWNFEELVIFPF